MKRPLEGLRMLDLTRVLAGPFCGMILADMGVETIKVEMPGSGDDARSFPPFIGGESAYFMSVNRNKKSLTLNLKEEKGKKILMDLVKISDIVLENFRPGTMEKLGIGYQTLASANPRIIYAACSGYGHSGPYMRRAAYDMIVQAMGGIMSVTGPDEQHPYRVGTSIGDVVAGLYTVIGILSALNFRNSTGEGQMVDVAMLDCQLAILESAISRYQATGVDPKPIGNQHPSISPFGVFKSKDGHIVIAAGNDKLFGTLCKVIGNPGLAADEKFKTNGQRVLNLSVLTETLEQSLSLKTTEEWLRELNDAGVPCGPINKISQVLNNPQIKSRDMVAETVNSRGTKLTVPGIPVKLTKSPGKISMAAPLLGEHNFDILKDELGYSHESIMELINEGVI